MLRMCSMRVLLFVFIEICKSKYAVCGETPLKEIKKGTVDTPYVLGCGSALQLRI